MNYANNTISYQTDKGKIIFSGLGIWGNRSSSIDKKSQFLSNLAVYAGNVRINDGANVNVAKQYYTIGNIKTTHADTNYSERRTSSLDGDKTAFILAKNSQIHANELNIFTSKGSHLNNNGAIIVIANQYGTGDMSIKADRISNKRIIAAYSTIKDNEYNFPSSINITTKHLINQEDAGIKAVEGIVKLETYKGKGYFDKSIKQNFTKFY